MTKESKTYHVSHTDLDGYGCQLVVNHVREFLKSKKSAVEFYNVNYGKPIDQVLSKICEVIQPHENILITDLNLTEEQSLWIDTKQKEIGFNLNLLDHHETGKPSAEKYDWYLLDTTRCGTKITYDYFYEKYAMSNISELSEIVNIINNYDLWKEENIETLTKGKALNQVLMDNRNIFPKVITNDSREYLLYLILKVGSSLSRRSILETETNKYMLERTYFSSKVPSYTDLHNEPLHVVRIYFMYHKILATNMSIRVRINDKIGEIYYGLSNIFQEFSHIRLRDNVNSDIDFIANINSQGYIGFRSLKEEEGGTKVNEIAKTYFDGGGHPPAAAGKLLGTGKTKFKDEDLYFLFLKQIPGIEIFDKDHGFITV